MSAFTEEEREAYIRGELAIANKLAATYCQISDEFKITRFAMMMTLLLMLDQEETAMPGLRLECEELFKQLKPQLSKLRMPLPKGVH